MKKILYYPVNTPGADAIFPYFKNIESHCYDAKDYSVLQGKHIDILVANTRLKINQETINRFPTVGIFSTISTGVDHVNFSDLENNHKLFLNSPGANASSVAEYCIVAMKYFFTPSELKNKSVGLIGFGHTGKALACYLQQENIEYKKFDPKYPKQSDALQDVLAADILSFHVSLTRTGEHKTNGLVANTYLRQMKNMQMILNTSRGEIFTKEVFEEILNNDKLYKVIDVFDPEPPDASISNSILQAKNLLVTPHVAGYSQYARISGTHRLATQFAEMFETRPLPGIGNFLIQNPALKTADFLEQESQDLKNALENENFIYFESRRNSYPAREDMQISLCNPTA